MILYGNVVTELQWSRAQRARKKGRLLEPLATIAFQASIARETEKTPFQQLSSKKFWWCELLKCCRSSSFGGCDDEFISENDEKPTIKGVFPFRLRLNW